MKRILTILFVTFTVLCSVTAQIRCVVDGPANVRKSASSKSAIMGSNVSGISQHEDGRIENIGNRVTAIQTPDGLFLADGYGNPCYRIYKNDVQSITETHVVRYSFDEDETELRPYNVSGYGYKCYNGISTLYFNIYN